MNLFKFKYSLLTVSILFLPAASRPSLAIETFASGARINSQQITPASENDGILFKCSPHRIGHVKSAIEQYLAAVGITQHQYIEKFNKNKLLLSFILNSAKDDFDTLQLRNNPQYGIKDEIVILPGSHGNRLKVATVSKKEILLALMQHGRLTTFEGRNCSVAALKEHVGIRQNIVAWAENLNWDWPDGEYAKWNNKYWRKGTPLPGVKIAKAFADAFKHQDDYSIGCYTATKLVVVQGILDYYSRIRKNRVLEKLIENRLEQDQDPLTNIEPARMWSFEPDFDLHDLSHPGKLLQIQTAVAPKNFVPGDWIYILNTDPVSSQKTGYEGSNAIYLGGNKFDDYYNDNAHAYTYQQKLDEVYQWRNGVFSRSRDQAKIKPLTGRDYDRLSEPPGEGGLTIDMRVYPYLFAGGNLPSLITATK